MKENLSPEDKLLKLIREEKRPQVKTTPPPAGVSREAYSRISRLWTMRHLEIAMVIAASLSFIYLVVSFVYPWVGLKEIRLPSVTQETSGDQPGQAVAEIKPYEFYQKELSQKQIFKTQYAQEERSAAIPADTDLAKEINLVGIIAGGNPQAIIVDLRTQKTYYVAKGQFIGDYKVEDIKEGKIILEFQGKRYELSM